MAKKLFYTEKELPQRSEKWLKVRDTCLGGSDVGCVLGLTDKYEKAHTLWKRKTKRLKPKTSNKAMTRGAEMEGEAADAIIKYLKTEEGIKNPKITPYFAKHPDYDFIGVSFDGVDIKNGFITEIKCPSTPWMFRSVFENGIQDYYYPQVQLQLFVANKIWGIKKAFFCSYYPDGAYILNMHEFKEYLKTLAVIDIDYDEAYCMEMLKVVDGFWSTVEQDEWDADKYSQLVEEFKRNTTC